MYIPLFLCMFFCVCLLYAAVKTYTKRDVALKEKNIKREKRELEKRSDFSAYTEKIRKQREQKQKQRGKTANREENREGKRTRESFVEVEEPETSEELVMLTENDCATPLLSTQIRLLRFMLFSCFLFC